MSAEKMRESFEAWAITSAWLGLVGDDLEFIDGGYVYPEVQSAWLSWQASRATIEVELPDSPGHYYNGAPCSALADPIQCWRDGYARAAERIKDIGLKVKPC